MRIARFSVGVAAIAVLGLTATSIEAQNGQVVGQVTDAQTGAALGDVQVYLVGAGIGALTRQNGRYLLLNVPVGSYELTHENVSLFKENMMVMHPLPRNEEIPKWFDNDRRAFYFKQIENGLFIRMAILEGILNHDA